MQYSKNGEGWRDLTEPGPNQSSYNFTVEWNSNYKFRIRGEDKVGNLSEWYPLNYKYPEFNTPSMPTKFKDIRFVDKLINVEFYIHNYAKCL